MLKELSNILRDLDPKVKVIGQKAGICDGVPLTSALVLIFFLIFFFWGGGGGIFVQIIGGARPPPPYSYGPVKGRVFLS